MRILLLVLTPLLLVSCQEKPLQEFEIDESWAIVSEGPGHVDSYTVWEKNGVKRGIIESENGEYKFWWEDTREEN